MRIETIGEVAARIKRGRSTIYAMQNEKDKRFDPEFPVPISLGNQNCTSKGYLAHEVDEWIFNRMDRRPTRHKK
tara:strand:- start:10192 stop:10413 length:222 start_codon:yes stop_codon:yes gene_type:complete